jgi:hypothetical protein
MLRRQVFCLQINLSKLRLGRVVNTTNFFLIVPLCLISHLGKMNRFRPLFLDHLSYQKGSLSTKSNGDSRILKMFALVLINPHRFKEQSDYY